MSGALRLGALVVVAVVLSPETSGAATGPVGGDVSANVVLTEEELDAALSARGSRGSAATSGGASSAGSSVVLAEIARELIGRSATSSQVLSLNLTNLVILFVLKAIIFGAGSMGFGWAGHKARSGSDENGVSGLSGLVSQQEMLLGLSYLVDGEGRCLNRVACQEPESAAAYARAGRLLAGGARLLSGVIPYDSKYDGVLDSLQEAVEFGRNGGRCETRFSCVTT